MPKDGEVRKRRRGRSGTKYEIYRDPPGEWRTTTGEDYKKARDAWYEQNNNGTGAYKSFGAPTDITTSLRYPKDCAMAANADYVLFEFYKYSPPFQGNNIGATKDGTQPGGNIGLQVYNRSVTEEARYEKVDGLDSVILYMPEDISTGYRTNWSGKNFSNMGRDILSTAGGDNPGQFIQNAANTLGDAFTQGLQNAGTQAIIDVIAKTTGESISPNDVFAATRGVIFNPNTELMFGGFDLRNFQLNYKLVPRNESEANNIKKIINVFRKAALPSFSAGSDLPLGNLLGQGKNQSANFIRVPSVCRVSFMRGGSTNSDVPQYKMCAITQVDINYTPDGTYATYEDGSMVAYGLSLNFQEMKLVYSEEVEKY
jgi:hypothetical protein